MRRGSRAPRRREERRIAESGVGEARSTAEAGQRRRREGASLLERFGRRLGQGDWREPGAS